MKQTTILFDINETVLNLASLRPKFNAAFGDEHYTDTWFAMLLHTSTVSMITDVKTDFAMLAKISLQTLAAKLNIQLTPETIADILGGFSSLIAHQDIKPALSKLRNAGFKVVALSNSSTSLITKQIHNATLSEYFDDIISVEQAGTFKPSHEAYQFAAQTLAQDAEQLRLVATHDWDTHGAMCAGLKAAYINRSGALYNPLYHQPEIYESTMQAVVDKIISIDK